MNHSFTFLRLARCTHATRSRIPHDDPIGLAVSAHALPRGANPARCRTSLAKENGHPRDVQRHRERTVHRPVSRMAASQHSFTSDVLSNHCQMAPSLRTPHYTTVCSLSPHATLHNWLLPLSARHIAHHDCTFRGGRVLQRRPGAMLFATAEKASARLPTLAAR